MKECQKCFKIQPKKDFGKFSSATDGLKSQCRRCVSTYNRIYKERTKISVGRRWS